MRSTLLNIRARSFFLLCSFVLATIMAHSQSSPQKAPPPSGQNSSPPATVRVTSRLVQVTVSVQDKDGKAITGLTKDDFTILDQGQRQQVAVFSSEQTNHLAVNAAGAPPNLFSNHLARGAPPPLTVIVMDAYYSHFFDIMTCPNGRPVRPYARCFDTVGTIFHEVETFISRMQPQDRVALYEVANHLYLLQDFSSDPAALQRGLDRGRDFATNIFIPRSQMDPIDLDAHAMDAMHAIANRLANVPGRKNLIWLSGDGFPPAGWITSDKIGTTSKTLGNADLPLTAMDARELFPICPAGSCGGPVGVGGGGTSGPTSGADGPTPNSASYGAAGTTGRRPQLHDFDYAKNLAEESGGTAVYDKNDLAGQIRKVIDDATASYVLGYYPAHDKWNGEFREIRVKVDRPGVEVRARKGYYAVAAPASAPKTDVQKMTEAILSPFDSTDLSLDVQVDAVDNSGVRQLRAQIHISPGQAKFKLEGNRWTDEIEIAWVQLDASRHSVAKVGHKHNLSTSQQDYEQISRDGLKLPDTVDCLLATTDVRLLVRDMNSGAIGSVDISLSRLFPQPAAPAPPRP